MYVCHCRGVTDRAINHEVARGATTIEDLGEACGAGSRCGSCWPALEALLHTQDHRAEGRELVDALR